jgi:hypothetical protein
VLNFHAPTEDKIDDIKGRLYEELEQVFDKLPRYHIKILLGEFNAKVGRLLLMFEALISLEKFPFVEQH